MPTDESGLFYMRSRYYSPDLRQFLSADSYMGDLYHPASLNPYSYVEGNPVRYIDPMGYWATPFEKYQGHYSLGKQNPQVMVKPRTKAYYVGKLSADLMMFYHGLAAMAAGGAMMGGGTAASSTGAGTLVGAPAVVEGLAIAEYGMFVASNSMTNIQNDFEEAAKGIGGSNQGVNPLERSKGDFEHIKKAPEIERKFNLPKGSYHPSGKKGIKDAIIQDARRYFPKEMKKIGTNPDLAFAKDGQVMIVSQTDKSLSVVTDLNIYHYIE